MAFVDGTPRPRRCADPIDDDTLLEDAAPALSSRPKRANAKASRIKLGIAALTASALTLTAVAVGSLANAAEAAAPDAVAVVAPFDRGSQESRDAARTELDPQAVSDQVAQRAAALTDLNKNVASSQAEDASAQRAQVLAATKQSITTEDKRLTNELNKLQFPAQGAPGSKWGMRLHPILGYYRMHAGIDVGAACGSPIRAVYDGNVISASYDGGSGNNVKIDHGTFRGKTLQTASLHMTNYIVSTGDKVKKGQVIGYVGNTGLSTECHLHFETVWGGANVDPESLLANP